MIEEDLRAAFARHESLAPPVGPLRAAIDRVAVRRRRRQRLHAAAAALVVVAGIAVGVPVLARTVGTSAHGPESTPAAAAEPSAVPDRELNFLVLGVDGRGDTGSYRADSVLIAHVPADRSRVYLVSLPRDLWVRIPGHGDDRLNAAFTYGSRGGGRAELTDGADLTARVVSDLTGLRFDGSVVLTFPALRALTDAVGGVRVCLPRTAPSTGRVLPAGCHQLDGVAALTLLRQRVDLPDEARDRDRNAQRLAAALLQRVADRDLLGDPAGALALLHAAGGDLIVDLGDLPLTALIGALAGTIDAEPVGVSLPTSARASGDGSHLRLDPVLSRDLFDALRQDRAARWADANPRQLTRQR